RSGTSRSGGTSNGSRTSNRVIPANLKNEWLILEAYQQLQTEEKQAQERKAAKDTILRCKEDLDRQIFQNQKRAEREKKEEELYMKEQRLHQEQYMQDQEETKKNLHQKLLEEKQVRAFQIMQNERRREKERNEKKKEDQRALEACQRYLKMEEEAQV
ncbi:unnamed protein product, partial [Discosporangium mesarthrocarpum]